MTKEEIAVLGHAFFDGKVLQSFTSDGWEDYSYRFCPDLDTGLQWRIKPDVPKTITICTFMNSSGKLVSVKKDSVAYLDVYKLKHWTHIKSLDQVVEVE